MDFAIISLLLVFSFNIFTIIAHKFANPDAYLSTIQIIARHGYPSRAYTIQTGDGYLLTLHRIPYSKYSLDQTPGQPVFLQHGLLGSSADWVLTGNKSLAFILSDTGYDVWLGNARGNTYSRGHVNYTIKSSEFWDFSFHEMGFYDLPSALAFVESITKKTGKIIYIGHSMGTTMFFVYASTNAQSSQTVKAMIALAPVAYMSDVRSPIKYVAPWTNDIEWLAKHLGLNEFLPNSEILKFLADIGCDKCAREMKLCEELIFLFAGFDKKEFDPNTLPLVLSHEPAGSSTKTFVHYAQEIRSGGNFCEFDYGSAENLKRYGTKQPPNYNITNIKVPIYLISALNDLLAGPKDVKKLSSLLPNKIGDYVVPLKDFNHIDFLWAIDVPKLVYKPVIKVMQNYTNF